MAHSYHIATKAGWCEMDRFESLIAALRKLATDPNLDEYKLHMIDALPDKVQVDFVEPYDVIGPYGAKGIGEPALLPPGAARADGF